MANKNKTNNRSTTSDKALLEDLINGDMEAFEFIVNRYKDRLMNFVFRFIGDYDVAEDIVQETFLRVFRKRRDYKAIANFSTWIFTIAGNLAKSEIRRQKRWRFLSLDWTNENMEKGIELPDSGKLPDDIADEQITDTKIQKAIDSLPIRYKEAIILRDVQGLSYQQISQILECPVGTVKSRVNRARFRIQKKLKLSGVDEQYLKG